VKPGMTCSEGELRDHCVTKLGRFKTPRYLRFVAHLPKGPSGKVQRLKLIETAAA
jgi:long-chain acyl-CoA synthetase